MMNDIQIGPVINKLSRRLKMVIDRDISSNGITGEQSRLLHYLYVESQQRDMFQRDLEHAFNVRRATATGMLKLLEKNGFIVRESVAEDARLKKITLTDKARQLDERIGQDIRATEELLRDKISDSDLQTFLRVARQMDANIATHMDEDTWPHLFENERRKP